MREKRKNYGRFLQFHDISMTTISKISITMKMKLRTIDNFLRCCERLNKYDLYFISQSILSSLMRSL